ncbi:MAG: FkbM family methyltransferase [Novosphingobium sp.]|nr:FkbM family methyltransferase [Novosphingobium sp.]
MPALRHRAAHFLLKKLGFFNRSYYETAFGRRFKIPIVNGRKAYVSEPWMAEIIHELFRLKDGAFIDVGVNLGQTMLKVAAINPLRSYLGFEPNPACADYATELAAANNLDFKVVPAGLGPETSVLDLQFYRDDDTDPSASLMEGFRPGAVRTKQVVVIALSDLPGNLIPETISIVKIDVEGGEASVIEGIRTFLAHQRPFVLTEILPAYSADNVARVTRQQTVESILAQHDYAMFRIRCDERERFLELVPIEEIGIQTDLANIDYLMAPAEDVPRLTAQFGRRSE